MLVGGDEQAMAQFDVRALLAFLDPLGVRLKERKHLLVRRNGFLLQQPALDQVQVFVEHPVKVGQRFPVRPVHRLVAQVEQAGVNLGGKLAAHGQIVAHGPFDAGFLVGAPAIDDLAGAAFARAVLVENRLGLFGGPARDELLDVPGIGPAKLEAYGDSILELLRG